MMYWNEILKKKYFAVSSITEPFTVYCIYYLPLAGYPSRSVCSFVCSCMITINEEVRTKSFELLVFLKLN